jgi:hypothetical protein
MSITTDNPLVIEEILVGLERPDENWAERDYPDGTSGHAAFLIARHRAQTEKRRTEGRLSWRDLVDEQITEVFATTDAVELRAGLVRLGVIVAAWAEAIDRRTAVTE